MTASTLEPKAFTSLGWCLAIGVVLYGCGFLAYLACSGRRQELESEAVQPGWKVFQRRLAALLWKDFEPMMHRHGESEAASYRGLFHYMKDVIEKMAALGLLLWAVIMFFIFLSETIKTGDLQPENYIGPVVKSLAVVLLIDAILQVADMVDSPGIEELADVLVTTLGGVLLLIISAVNIEQYAKEGDLVMAPLAITVSVFLLLGLREWARKRRP